MQYPDSPEGVAFALMMLIVGASDQKLPSERDACESETLALYRRCLDAVHRCPSGVLCEEVRFVH